MEPDLKFAEHIIKCIQNNVKNTTVFCNPSDFQKVAMLVNKINLHLVQNDKDLFVTVLHSEMIQQGELILTTEAGLKL